MEWGTFRSKYRGDPPGTPGSPHVSIPPSSLVQSQPQGPTNIPEIRAHPQGKESHRTYTPFCYFILGQGCRRGHPPPNLPCPGELSLLTPEHRALPA